MSTSKQSILQNYKKEISVIRGRKYTFNLSNLTDTSGTIHPFYITTSSVGGANFPGAITTGISYASEMWIDVPLENPNTVTRSSAFTKVSNGYSASGSQPTDIYLQTKLRMMEVGEFYKITLKTQQTAGTLRLYVGGAQSGLISASGTHEIHLRALSGSSSYTNNSLGVEPVIIKGDKNFTGSIESLSIRKIAATEGMIEFTPSYDHPDTLYYQCGVHQNMGAKINVLNAPGPVENPQEFYFTLGINQTNRTYPPIMKSDPKIVEKFLVGGLPAGLFKNVFNLAPTGTVQADRAVSQYYDVPNNDKTVSLSGLISDPEDDTLKYRWYHYSPLKSLDGLDLETVFTDNTSLTTTATLKEPPTDMIYTLHLDISDSDNVTTIPINIKVSGTVDFDSWAVGSGISTFDLGDSNIPFEDLE